MRIGPYATKLIQIAPLPQIVPSRVCLTCAVCCRFPESDSALRPYFTAEEIRQAVGRGIDPAHFPDHSGSQIQVVPHPSGEGYLCPAFDPVTSECRIYEDRPLDCRIYPLAVMWSANGREVVLGWDQKCPFLAECGNGQKASGNHKPLADVAFESYAVDVAGLVEHEYLETFANNPGLIGQFQDDVVILRSLPRVTDRVTGSPFALRPLPVATLHPLTLADRSRFEQVLEKTDTSLAAYAFAYHYIWRHQFTYWWAELAGHFCLFAAYVDGLYLALPPLGPGPLSEPLMEAFALMRQCNGATAVSRVENVPEGLEPEFEKLGYRLKPKDPDYLYRVSDLVLLAGDQYKSQRAACNALLRAHQVCYEPYCEDYRDRCLALYRRWAAQQEARGLDPVSQQMLRDAAPAHWEVLTHAGALGLVGRVVWIDAELAAYTFGYPRAQSVFCVLLEVTDRSINGMAPFIFREFCREAGEQGYVFINTMDDSGLEGLRRAKLAYHPVRLVPSFIATEQRPD